MTVDSMILEANRTSGTEADVRYREGGAAQRSRITLFTPQMEHKHIYANVCNILPSRGAQIKSEHEDSAHTCTDHV